jgi:hypothetical protein
MTSNLKQSEADDAKYGQSLVAYNRLKMLHSLFATSLSNTKLKSHLPSSEVKEVEKQVQDLGTWLEKTPFSDKNECENKQKVCLLFVPFSWCSSLIRSVMFFFQALEEAGPSLLMELSFQSVDCPVFAVSASSSSTSESESGSSHSSSSSSSSESSSI